MEPFSFIRARGVLPDVIARAAFCALTLMTLLLFLRTPLLYADGSIELCDDSVLNLALRRDGTMTDSCEGGITKISLNMISTPDIAIMAGDAPSPPHDENQVLAKPSQLFNQGDDANVELKELAAFVKAIRQPFRITQVDLSAHPKISQFNEIDASDSGFGKNACGLVAAAAAMGGKVWIPLVSKIAKAAGKSYNPETGIQPSNYALALEQVFGNVNVTSSNKSKLSELYRQLEKGNIVIVDLKVNADSDFPSITAPTYAHFARVLGIDVGKQEIYIENTVSGAPFWTLPIKDFLLVWEKPEITATVMPDSPNAEAVTDWMVVINNPTKYKRAIPIYFLNQP